MAVQQSSVQWIPILGYHRVVEHMPASDKCWLCVTQRQFANQLTWFARLGYQSISLEEVGQRLARGEQIPPRRFVITFDDGYVDTLTVAGPVLRHFGYTATVFVVTSLVGERNVWDEHTECLAPLMTWDQIRQWLGQGFSVGSHTVSHPRLSRLPADQVLDELSQSRQTLESQLGIPIETFCYPYGDWSPAVVEQVPQAGYVVACNDVGRREHGQHIMARTDPRTWPVSLAPLICSYPWYFEANRRGMLPVVQRGMHFLWHSMAHQPRWPARSPRKGVTPLITRASTGTGPEPATKEAHS
jgi:peptidoglycan/xylan/chitin deacetylase (PgdA/CDA1 family)